MCMHSVRIRHIRKHALQGNMTVIMQLDLSPKMY
jgi:hypothetical protein